ncbi:MAG: L,D-transpeptidase [Anaerolineae bacterium]|nr:L,D-transpeptidase [Anaerolineae bacterium]
MATGDLKTTRRRFLKIGSGLALALPFIYIRPVHGRSADPIAGEPPEPPDPKLQPIPYAFGRAFRDNLIVRERPTIHSPEVRRLRANEVIPIKGEVIGVGPTTYNPFWYLTDEGYVHSANVQPCNHVLNEPLSEVGEDGLWAEISVPFTELRAAADPQARVRMLLYYGCVFRIVRLARGADGKTWYVIADGNAGNAGLGFVPAEHLRPLTAEDFAPLSPDVPLDKKRIEVNLKAQTATAYEYDEPVFTARVATGGKYRTPAGIVDFFTIPGEHRIFRKIAGTRMRGGTPGYDYYDLPGVSWASFFTGSGIAFHGVYWHNDYGRPRSHGCVNMLPDQARWVFRWTMPTYPHTARATLRTRREEGSLVRVF